MTRALVVDDDPAIRRSIKAVARDVGCEVTDAEDGLDAVGKLGAGRFDVVITDLRMPRADGFAVLAAVSSRQPGTPTIMLTAHGAVAECVTAMKGGAFDFLTKPFHAEELEAAIRRALEVTQRSGRAGKDPARERPQVSIIGDSPRLRAVLDSVERVATTDATVLIAGETGTGKEVIARLVHGLSDRAGRPFVAINCGAIPEGLIESELFGHARGSFTGATDKRVGRFVQAEGGTLFLDEVGELPPATQVKLLRVLQEREVTPVGESRSVAIDVRVIAATHRDLEAMVETGAFRQDLYYRLNVVPLEMPALRDRAEDIPALANHFLADAGRRLGRELRLSPEALEALCRYAWPGNVREVENLIERVAILGKGGEITVADLPEKFRHPPVATGGAAAPPLPEDGLDLVRALGDIEGKLIDEALRKSGGNRSQAARLLGLNRTTLIEKLKRKTRL
ncbi:MAG: sigma-54-dependent transcriptional regulator [Polyangia bacterium]|jgi:DNA-binding NtrC family response regulator